MYIRKVVAILLLALLIGNVQPVVTVYGNSTNSQSQMAEILSSIGLLSGDSKGDYMLANQLKRSEAATLLVKLVGKYSYVKENEDEYTENFFSDVKGTEWYVPFITYCGRENLLAGFTDGFRPNDPVSEQSFLVILLKALGYTSDDFTWNQTVYQKAYEVGILNDSEYKVKENGKFLRGDVAQLVYNALKANMKDDSYTLLQCLVKIGQIDPLAANKTGLLPDVVKTDITSINVDNGQNITILLNEDIKGITSDQIKILDSKNKKLNADLIEHNGSMIKIKTDKQTAGEKYTVELSNIEDLDGIILAKVSKIFSGYENLEIKSDFYKISKIEPISTNELILYFTHPVNENAEYSAYYQLFQDDSLNIDSKDINAKLVSWTNNAVSITFKNKYLEPDKEYSLKISGELTSAYGVKLNEGTGDSINFYSTENDKVEEFKINSVSTPSGKTIQIDFSKELNFEAAGQAYRYYVTDGNKMPVKVESAIIKDTGYNKNKTVILTLASSMDKNKEYELVIVSLPDMTKQYVLEGVKKVIKPSYSEVSEIKLLSVVPVEDNIIYLYFDRQLDEVSATNTQNFIISDNSSTGYNSKPTKASLFDGQRNILKLYLPADIQLVAGRTYRVIVQPNIIDSMGNKMNKSIDYNFQVSSVTQTQMEVKSAVIISTDAIKVTFSKEIAMEAPNALTQNYSIEYIDENGLTAKKLPIAINYIDSDTVVLKFDKLDSLKTYSFRYKNIKDCSGKLISMPDNNGIIVQMGK